MNSLKKGSPILIAILLLTGCCQLFAQGIRFVHNLDSALAMAKAEHKPIFIDFYTSWCAPCKMMSKDVFPQEKVGNFFNQTFINCKIQCDDNGIGVEVGKKYAVNAYPTTMFLNSDGELIHSAAGGLSADEFIDLAKIALDPNKNLSSLIRKWEGGQRDTAFVNHYFATLKAAWRIELAKGQFETYFYALTKAEKTGKNSFELIKLLGFPPFSPLFSFVEDNKRSFYKSVGNAVVDKYLSNTYTWYLQAMVLENGSAARRAYFAAKARFKAKNYRSYDEVAMFIEIFETFDTTGNVDIKEYQRRGTAFLDKYGANNDSYTIALTQLLGNCTGRDTDGSAGIKWMETLLARNNDPKYLNSYFYILWRNRQFDKAMEIGRQIHDEAIRGNESTAQIDGQMAMVAAYREKLAKTKAAASQNGTISNP